MQECLQSKRFLNRGNRLTLCYLDTQKRFNMIENGFNVDSDCIEHLCYLVPLFLFRWIHEIRVFPFLLNPFLKFSCPWVKCRSNVVKWGRPWLNGLVRVRKVLQTISGATWDPNEKNSARNFPHPRFSSNLDITARNISFFDAIENIFNRVAIQKFVFHWIHIFYRKDLTQVIWPIIWVILRNSSSLMYKEILECHQWILSFKILNYLVNIFTSLLLNHFFYHRPGSLEFF